MSYITTIISEGVEAKSFLAEGLALTFGTAAPDDLKAYCYVLSPASMEGHLEPGQLAVIADQRWTITAIGEVAEQNLAGLGHVTLVFDGARVPRMAGAIHLGGCDEPPALAAGVRLEVGHV